MSGEGLRGRLLGAPARAVCALWDRLTGRIRVSSGTVSGRFCYPRMRRGRIEAVAGEICRRALRSGGA